MSLQSTLRLLVKMYHVISQDVVWVLFVIFPAVIMGNEFLDAHNYYRAKVKAKNMEAMVRFKHSEVVDNDMTGEYSTWSDILEESATKWVNKCIWAHSPGSDRKIQWEGQSKPARAGENLWMSTGNEINVTRIVGAWFKEKEDYHIKDNTCDEGETCGHYTQVVWAISNKLGCAVKRCTPLKHEDGSVKKDSAYMAVCHYGRGGNIVGTKPYDKGKHCKTCPEGMACNEMQLCVKRRGLKYLLDALLQNRVL